MCPSSLTPNDMYVTSEQRVFRRYGYGLQLIQAAIAKRCLADRKRVEPALRVFLVQPDRAGAEQRARVRVVEQLRAVDGDLDARPLRLDLDAAGLAHLDRR